MAVFEFVAIVIDMVQLSWNEINNRAIKFVARWRGTTYEKGESQSFWSDFLQVFGIDRRRHGAFFEHPVKKSSGKQGYIDLFYPNKLLIEQKSTGKDLDVAQRQAFSYLIAIPEHDLPEAIVVSDFKLFRFINLETREKTEFAFEDLSKHIQLFGFLLGKTSKKIAEEDPVNREAAESMARLHNQLRDNNYAGHDLELLLVRLVFLMFAEDSGIFDRGILLEYISNRTSEDGSDLGLRLLEIFQVLNTPEKKRQEPADEILASLPYVNGALFNEKIDFPRFDYTMRHNLIEAMRLDWSKVSPAIFGSMFQGVMDEEQRRNLGAHYTSEANILKVIKPLFLDNLYREFSVALRVRGKTDRSDGLRKLQDKIANLRFLDPACGCGNFLVITYRELRRLEHKIVKTLYEGDARQVDMMASAQVGTLKVNVDQMYGIEIEEFPSLVAQTALWLTDHQMNMEYSKASGQAFKRIPLKTSATIVHANALTKNWGEVVVVGELNYILGNPPFIGQTYQSKEQKAEVAQALSGIKKTGVLDFVSAWYGEALKVMKKNPKIQSALVSTNSITQGEQVSVLWQYLLKEGIVINFAHRTFKWSNDAKGNAAVYCVIIGFALTSRFEKHIFDYLKVDEDPFDTTASNINPYLLDAPNIIIKSRSKPLSKVAPMKYGNKPVDGGNLLLTLKDKNELVASEPEAKKYIKRLISAKEFIQGIPRYCLWLIDISPSDLRSMPLVLERVSKVREMRLASCDEGARKLADRPTEFRDIVNPETCIVVPCHSSERREYVPMGFFGKDEIVSNSCQLVPDATLYHFGVLTSRMHMAWMRVVAGRLESRYRYSKDIVYNNFVWPDVSDEQKDQIAGLAQAVLDARAEYPKSTLADLYDPVAMPPSLRRAHNNLDKAVDQLYRLLPGIFDTERVAHLFELYKVMKASTKSL